MTTETVWGFDLVIVEQATGTVVGFAPTAAAGDTVESAHAKLRIQQPRINNMPPGCVVQGVRPHVGDFVHLFANPQIPALLVRGWKPAGFGPAVPIECARAVMGMAQQANKPSIIV